MAVIKVEQAARHKARVGEQSNEDYIKHLEKRFGVPLEEAKPKNIEDLKSLYEVGKMDAVYGCVMEDGKDAVIILAENGFKMLYNSKPTWVCIMHYQYLAIDDDPKLGFEWIVETTYEKEVK